MVYTLKNDRCVFRIVESCQRSRMHCTKIEEILSGKLYCLCSDGAYLIKINRFHKRLDFRCLAGF